jgi:hypothetical protein
MIDDETAARDLADALRQLVNAPLPATLALEEPFWIAARNARATLSNYADVTGIDGEQDQ